MENTINISPLWPLPTHSTFCNEKSFEKKYISKTRTQLYSRWKALPGKKEQGKVRKGPWFLSSSSFQVLGLLQSWFFCLDFHVSIRKENLLSEIFSFFLFISRSGFPCSFQIFKFWYFPPAFSLVSVSFHIKQIEELGFQDQLFWPCVLSFVETREGNLRVWLIISVNLSFIIIGLESLSIFQISVSLLSWNRLIFSFSRTGSSNS